MIEGNSSPSSPPAAPQSNAAEFTVSELSAAVKRTVEDSFGHVRVRGEISQPKVVRSGHCYLTLKDENANLSGVIWKGNLARLSIRPEEGMEVIATGKLTTFAGQSKYQIVIDGLELAGEGALLKLLEDRRKKLASEGLFDADRKAHLPFLPRVIGVVTSPTGAVIRDILHRLNDRFPRHVIVWPVRVQGDAAAGEITRAITGFNALAPDGPVPRPDLLIVARGGGSLEDLWAFNEEAVVRAAAASTIPLISAVGHETDTTLIDHAADVRAPTPTAAAEMAVPVRMDLIAQVQDRQARLSRATARLLEERALALTGMLRGLPDIATYVAERAQWLDDRAERLDQAARTLVATARDRLAVTSARLRCPTEYMDRLAQSLSHLSDLAARALTGSVREASARLAPLPPRLPEATLRVLDRQAERLATAGERLEAVSHAAILKRGFALVRTAERAVVTSAAGPHRGQGLSIEFADGEVAVQVADGAAGPSTPPPAPAPKPKPKPPKIPDDRQGSLL